ncbi:S-adenosyl-L-methionine:benzoic acid/salicylic acid carboxyl methyltransferase 3 [Sarracenia purpurea var. burkii]
MIDKVPEGVENNKGNIYMASTSPPSVLKAYKHQFQKDFSLFLKCRSEEMVAGGRMVLTIQGRESDDPSSRECCYIWELLALALNEMVSQGLIEEEKVNSFNIPQYTPSPAEVKLEVQKDGSFTIDRLEVSTVNWCVASGNELCNSDQVNDGGYYVAKCIRAVAESMLASHFGGAIIDELFQRFEKIVGDRMAKEKTQFFNVTISVMKN